MEDKRYVRCNDCMWIGEEENLELVYDIEDDEFIDGCPNCKTDKCLMDLTEYNDLLGKKWKDISEEYKEFLFSTGVNTVNHTGEDIKEGKCIVDFGNGLSATGECVKGNEETILIIDDDSKIYCPQL